MLLVRNSKYYESQGLEKILDELETRISPEKIIKPILGPKFTQLWQQARQLAQSQQPQSHNSQLQTRVELALRAYDYITFEKDHHNLAGTWIKSREQAFERFWKAFQLFEKDSNVKQITRKKYSEIIIKYREAEAPRIIEELGKFIQAKSERETPTISSPEIFNKSFLLFYDFYHRFFLEDIKAIYPLEMGNSVKKATDKWRTTNPQRLAHTAFIKIIEYFTRFCRTQDNRERNKLYDKVRLAEGYAKFLPLTITPKLAHIQKWMQDNIITPNLQHVAKDFPTPEQTYLNLKYK